MVIPGLWRNSWHLHYYLWDLSGWWGIVEEVEWAVKILRSTSKYYNGGGAKLTYKM